jgi:hypothetical protein
VAASEIAILAVVALNRKWSIAQFALTSATFLPGFLWLIREGRKHRDAAHRVEALAQNADQLIEELENGVLSREEAARRSSALQDALFDHRSSGPLIFEWVYSLFRSEQERQMNEAAELRLAKLSGALRDLEPPR